MWTVSPTPGLLDPNSTVSYQQVEKPMSGEVYLAGC